MPQTNSVLLAWFGAICRPYILEGSSIYILIKYANTNVLSIVYIY